MSTSSSHRIRKHFIALESNPKVFTDLIRRLGVDPTLAFTEIYSLDDPDILAVIPKPVFALILVFPTTPKYKEHKAKEEATRSEYTGSGAGEDVVWFKQTINNACGFYAILHAGSNGPTKDFIAPGSILAKILEDSIPLPPDGRAVVLETSTDLETAYHIAAREGDSAVPENPEDEVDYHYVCYVQIAKKDGALHLYKLDGDAKGPIDLGPLDDGRLLEAAIQEVKAAVDREGGNIGFNLMVLGPDMG